MKKIFKVFAIIVSCIFVITSVTAAAGCGFLNGFIPPSSNQEDLPPNKDDELNGDNDNNNENDSDGDDNNDDDNVGGGDGEGDNDGNQDKPPFTPHESAAGIANRLTKENEKIVNFSQGASPDFIWADGYSNGNMFNCTWRKSSATVKDGVMSMSVSKEGNGYAGAEYRSKNKYSYGFYSVCMKPAKCSGVVSSFFTYTNEPVWDEIDIEFLGKDTSIVQFNFYTNGKGDSEFIFNLGFDASLDFHEYAFDWSANGIVWYVDGVAVYRATATSQKALPSHSMQIMMNVWNGIGVDDWLGSLNNAALPAKAQYKWFAYAPSSN